MPFNCVMINAAIIYQNIQLLRLMAALFNTGQQVSELICIKFFVCLFDGILYRVIDFFNFGWIF